MTEQDYWALRRQLNFISDVAIYLAAAVMGGFFYFCSQTTAWWGWPKQHPMLIGWVVFIATVGMLNRVKERDY